jgi:hypothetical protein
MVKVGKSSIIVKCSFIPLILSTCTPKGYVEG